MKPRNFDAVPDARPPSPKAQAPLLLSDPVRLHDPNPAQGRARAAPGLIPAALPDHRGPERMPDWMLDRMAASMHAPASPAVAAAPSLRAGPTGPDRPGPDMRTAPLRSGPAAADRPAPDMRTASRPGPSAAPAPPPQRAEPSPGDLYLSHFGLDKRPFSLLPDPDFLFWSPAHRRAYAILEYGVMTHAPITLVTGEVGAGKTTLVHQLMRGLGSDVQVGLISNAHGSRGDLLRWVQMSLGQASDPQATYVDLFAAFQQHLIAQYAAGRRVVLIFDEAQNLDSTMLEELRMLTNINSGKDDLVQLVLVGQPELRDLVRRPGMAQFAQRVAASFHLPAMAPDTLRAYVGHRLRVAGGRPGLISADALRLIHAVSGGVPRLVNQLCDLALVYAYAQNGPRVTRRDVQQVLDDGVFFAAAGPPDDRGGRAAPRGDRHGD